MAASDRGVTILDPIPSEIVAAHEAGHATVYLACGIPVEWISVKTVTVSPGVTQHGFTMALENDWVASSTLSDESKTLRRILGKAGGLAGEWLTNLFKAQQSPAWAKDDVRQIGGGLRDLGLIASDASVTPMQHVAALVQEAIAILQTNRTSFEHSRQLLETARRIERPACTATWQEADDQRVLQLLRTLKATIPLSQA